MLPMLFAQFVKVHHDFSGVFPWLILTLIMMLHVLELILALLCFSSEPTPAVVKIQKNLPLVQIHWNCCWMVSARRRLTEISSCHLNFVTWIVAWYKRNRRSGWECCSVDLERNRSSTWLLVYRALPSNWWTTYEAVLVKHCSTFFRNQQVV